MDSQHSRLTLPLDFGAWLARLVERVEVQEREIMEIKERLERLEPVEAPMTPEQLCARHRFKPGTVRDWLFRRATNGLESYGAVVKKGRRLYLYETSFLRWLRETAPSHRRRVADELQTTRTIVPPRSTRGRI